MPEHKPCETLWVVTFAGLILKNLSRQRVRTLLTMLGIAVGIMTVVALGAVTAGLRASSSSFVHAGDADFLVAQKGASDLTFSTLDESVGEEIAARPDVARATPVFLHVADTPDNPYFFLLGYDPQAIATEPLQILTGSRLSQGRPSEIMLGKDGAEALGKGVGETVELEGRTFRVVGIYSAGDDWRDAGAIAPLATVQGIARKPGVVTGVHVTAAPGRDPAQVADAIERAFADVATIASTEDYGKVDQGFKVLDAANLAISLLAVGIGAIGVMNTMIMSVFERTREIGILRAVGWRGSRVVRMVVVESAFLCLIAAVFGVAFGVLASRAILLVPAVSSFLTPAYEPAVFIRALLVGIVVAFVGALYPAIRAARLSPMEALRHE
jgi:putative ABC transport system permease protein